MNESSERFGDGTDLIPVFHGPTLEVEIVRSLLEEYGIPAASFGSGAYLEGAVDGPDRVMVRSKDLERASSVIAEALSDETETSVSADDDDEVEDDDDDFYSEEEPEEYADQERVPILADPPGNSARLIAIAVLLLGLGVAFVVYFAQRGGP